MLPPADYAALLENVINCTAPKIDSAMTRAIPIAFITISTRKIYVCEFK